MDYIFSRHQCEVFQVLDDTEAKAILLKWGMIERLKGNPERSLAKTRVPRHETDMAFAEIATCSDHSTHWIVGVRFSGSPNPADNGHLVFCYPKALVNMSDMEVVMTDLAGKMFPGGYDPLIIELKPPAN